MKDSRRYLALVVVLALCLSLFAACGGTKENTPSTTQAGTTGAGTTQATTTAKPEVARPESIVMAIGGTTALSDPAKAETFAKAVGDAIGTKFSVVYDTELYTRVSAMFAAKEQLDVVLGNTGPYFNELNCSQEIKQEWIDSSENIKKIPAGILSRQKTGGKIMGVPYRLYSAWVTWVRQDWLDSLGLAVPVSLDDYVAVLRAFTNNDPDKNGKKDTYGMSASNLWDCLNQFFWPMMNAQIKFSGDWTYDNDQEKYYHLWLTPEYKQYMTWLVGLYKEGLIDPLAPTYYESSDPYYNGFYNGKWGFLTDFAHNADTHVKGLAAVNPNAKMVPIAPPTGPAGKGYTANLSDIGFSIMQTCANPEGVMKYFIDWAHSSDGYNMFCFGPEGMNWKMENGAAVTTAEVVTCGLTPQHVILKDGFNAVIPMSQDVLNAFKVNSENLKWGTDPFTRPPVPEDNRMEDYGMKALELWAAMFAGKITVDDGFAQMQAKYKDSKASEWIDEINKDLTWAKNWTRPE